MNLISRSGYGSFILMSSQDMRVNIGVWLGAVSPFSTTAPGWTLRFVTTPEIGAVTSKKLSLSIPANKADDALAEVASAASISAAGINPDAVFAAFCNLSNCFLAASASTLSASTSRVIIGFSNTTSRSPLFTRSPISTRTLFIAVSYTHLTLPTN